jgi:hypothetical protein
MVFEDLWHVSISLSFVSAQDQLLIHWKDINAIIRTYQIAHIGNVEDYIYSSDPPTRLDYVTPLCGLGRGFMTSIATWADMAACPHL